jgi:hypothetical protein
VESYEKAKPRDRLRADYLKKGVDLLKKAGKIFTDRLEKPGWGTKECVGYVNINAQSFKKSLRFLPGGCIVFTQ